MYINVSFDPKQLKKDLQNLEGKLARNIRLANRAAAELVKSAAITNIQKGTRTMRYKANGRPLIYKRRSVSHVPSAPGEYPKSDTGRLVSSISVETDVNAAYVGSNLQYAAFLENGTKYMEPRPWLVRSYRENIDKVERLYNDAIRDSLK